MRKQFILFFLITLPGYLFAQPEFMNVKIQGDMQSMVNTFKNKGFLLKIKDDTYVSMNGSLNGTDIEINMVFTPKTKQIWKLVVYLPEQSSWIALKSEYQEYKNLLLEKYGKPSSEYDFFLSPYYENDGYEMSAVQLDKCRYATFWKSSNVMLEISKFKQVKVGYENPENIKLLDEEKKSIGLKNF